MPDYAEQKQQAIELETGTNAKERTRADYDALRQQAIELRKQGFSIGQIARRIAVHKSVAGRWVAHVPFTTHNDESRQEQLASFRDLAKYERACELRRAGWSYSMITDELGVNQSTLSGWLRDIVVEDHSIIQQRKRSAWKVTGQVNSSRYQARAQGVREAAKQEISAMFEGGLTKRELFLAGLMLYWGEGSKTQSTVVLGNADPAIIKMFLRWLRECLNVEDDNLRFAVYCYPDTNIPQAEAYWSKVTRIPLDRFYKAQVDTRTDKLSSNKGKLVHGTGRVYVMGEGSSDLHRKVLTWIEFLGRMGAT